MKKLKELNRKQKGILGVVGVVVIVAVVVITMLLTKPADKKIVTKEYHKIELKQKNFVIEFGDEYSLQASDYIKASKEVLKDTKIEVKNENNRDCPKGAECDEYRIIDVYKVGEYKATATYKKEKLKFTIEIKDTTVPTFETFTDKVEVEQGGDANGVISSFVPKDLSSVKIDLDVKAVDFNKPGEYKAAVTATDAYGNKTAKEFVIVVKEKDQAEEQPIGNNNTGNGSNPVGNTGGNQGSNPNNGNGGGNPQPTPQQPKDVCPGAYDPSKPCKSILMDDRNGQNHKLFATYAEVENIMNLMFMGDFNQIKAITGEDLSSYGQIVGSSITYNDYTKVYSFCVY